MKAAAIRVFVNDIDEAEPFYRDVLQLPGIGGSSLTGYLLYDIGGPTLIIEDGADEPDLVGRFTGLAFGVDDVDVAFEELTNNGVPFTGPPQKQAWGGILAHFRDPAGNTLTIVQSPE